MGAPSAAIDPHQPIRTRQSIPQSIPPLFQLLHDTAGATTTTTTMITIIIILIIIIIIIIKVASIVISPCRVFYGGFFFLGINLIFFCLFAHVRQMTNGPQNLALSLRLQLLLLLLLLLLLFLCDCWRIQRGHNRWIRSSAGMTQLSAIPTGNQSIIVARAVSEC